MAAKNEPIITINVIEKLCKDYTLEPRLQDPAKVIEVLRDLANGLEDKSIGMYGYTFSGDVTATDLSKATLSISFIEHKLMSETNAKAREER